MGAEPRRGGGRGVVCVGVVRPAALRRRRCFFFFPLFCSQAGQATVPSTMRDEWQTNPFMRCREETVKRYAGSEGALRARGTPCAGQCGPSLPASLPPPLLFPQMRSRHLPPFGSAKPSGGDQSEVQR